MDHTLIGQRLKKRRTELNLSLRALASQTDLTAAFLSQVERGVSNPSLNTLRRIADCMKVPMLYFLAERPNPSPVVRVQERSQIELDDSAVTYEMLSPDLSGSFVTIQGFLKPGNENIVRPLSIDTEEMVLVLNGRLLVGIGNEEFTLDSGDCITFQGKELKKMICGSEKAVRWISVITPPVF